MPCTVGVHPSPSANQPGVLSPEMRRPDRDKILVECDGSSRSVPGNGRLSSHSTRGGELLGLLLAFELSPVEIGVDAATAHQDVVRPALDDSTVVDDEDL